MDSLKQAVYVGSWEATNVDQLKERVHLEVKGNEVGLLRNALLGLMAEVRHAANNELLTVL